MKCFIFILFYSVIFIGKNIRVKHKNEKFEANTTIELLLIYWKQLNVCITAWYTFYMLHKLQKCYK